MRAYILAREDAISYWRKLMGPTKVYRARYTSPNTIRAQFGLTDTRNTTHGSGMKMHFQSQLLCVIRKGLFKAFEFKCWLSHNARSGTGQFQ